jgi:type I restriction enzyme S subunit
MNAERLLAHYEKIADAPDAIARLRQFILDLAVRGKLIAPNRKDEPPSSAHSRTKVDADERAPFELPPSWNWVTVGSVASTRLGKMLDKARNKGAPRPYLRNVNVRWFDFDLSDLLEMRFEDEELPEFELRRGDVLICEGGEPGRAAVWDDRANGIYFQKAIHRVRFAENVCPHFFVWALKASANDGRLSEYFTGTGIKHFTGKGLNAYRFPLPPRNEQNRIVAKVDELMALCDQLEKSRTAREETRDRLTAASLARLNDPAPETFQTDARFALDALPSMTARPDQIKQLRQTLLNLAVRGKLVPQDSREEPACELLRRLADNRQKYGRSREAVSHGEQPHLIPNTWEWVVLAQLITSGPQNGLSPKPTKRKDAPKAITLTATTAGTFNPAYFKYVDAQVPSGSDYWLKEGDLLFQRGNTRDYVGIAAVYHGPPDTFLFPDLIMRVRVSELVDLRYVHLASLAPPARTFLSTNASGAQATMPKINQTTLTALPIPLAPLEEQKRIVAKVDELMALCDSLEASLTAGETARSRLFDALLHEALEPTVDRLEVAA